MAAIFPILDVYSCIATKWTRYCFFLLSISLFLVSLYFSFSLRHMGFCITYTALLMKTWRYYILVIKHNVHREYVIFLFRSYFLCSYVMCNTFTFQAHSFQKMSGFIIIVLYTWHIKIITLAHTFIYSNTLIFFANSKAISQK